MRSFTLEEIEWAFGEWLMEYRAIDCYAWQYLTVDEQGVLTKHHYSRFVRELERQVPGPDRVGGWRNRVSRIVDAVRRNW
jgi:hypothetical protein